MFDVGWTASACRYALLVDDDGRPLGWIDQRDLAGAGPIDAAAATPGARTVEPETTLRDALSAMLDSSVQLGVVVDERERVMGLVSVDAIGGDARAGQRAAGTGRNEVSVIEGRRRRLGLDRRNLTTSGPSITTWC